MADATLLLDRIQHRHLLGYPKDVYASPYGLLGGGWNLPENIEKWREETGIGPISIRLNHSGILDFMTYNKAEPMVVFQSHDDAFMFKMKWL